MKKEISKIRNVFKDIKIENLIYLFILLLPIFDIFSYFIPNLKDKNLVLYLIFGIFIISFLKSLLEKNEIEKKEENLINKKRKNIIKNNIEMIFSIGIFIIFILYNHLLKFKQIDLLSFKNILFYIISFYIIFSTFLYKKTEKLKLAVNYSSFIYLFSILLAVVTNTGNFNYVDDIHIKKSYLGWFENTENLGLLMMSFLPFLCIFAKNKRRVTFTYLQTTGIFLYLIIIISNRIFLLSACIFLVMFLIFYLIENVYLKNKLKKELKQEAKNAKKGIENWYNKVLQKITKKEDTKGNIKFALISIMFMVIYFCLIGLAFKKITNAFKIFLVLISSIFLIYNFIKINNYTKLLKQEYMIIISSYIYLNIFMIKLDHLDINMLILLNIIFSLEITNIITKLQEREKRFEEYKYNVINKKIANDIQNEKRITSSLEKRLELEETKKLHEILDRTQSIYLANYLKTKKAKDILVIINNIDDIKDYSLINIMKNLSEDINLNLLILKPKKSEEKIKEIYFKNLDVKIYNFNEIKKYIYLKGINIFKYLNIERQIIYLSLNNLDEDVSDFIKLNKTKKKILWIKEDNISKISQNYEQRRILKEEVSNNLKQKYLTDIIIEDKELYNKVLSIFTCIYEESKDELEKYKKNINYDENMFKKINFLNLIYLPKFEESLEIKRNEIKNYLDNNKNNNMEESINILYFLNLKYTKEMDRTLNIVKNIKKSYIYKNVKIFVNIIGYAKEYEILKLKNIIRKEKLEDIIRIYDLKINSTKELLKTILLNTDIFVSSDIENRRSVEILNIYNYIIKKDKKILIIEENFIPDIKGFKNLNICKNNEIDIFKELLRDIKKINIEKEENIKQKINVFDNFNEKNNIDENEKNSIIKKTRQILFLD